MRIFKFLGTLLLVTSVFVGCNLNSKKSKDTKGETTKTNKAVAVTYKVASRYFIKNNVEELPSKIDSREEFEKYFGAAAVMGKNGMPTSIDFEKEYVIAVTVDASNKSTELQPVSLTKEGEKINFDFSVIEGSETSYTTRPSLVIIVSKEMDGNVTTNPIKAMSDGHNAKNSLDWEGEYEGTLPCADCEGIKTTILLKNNETYTMIITYLGEEEGREITEGNFEWDTAGTVITLINDDEEPYKLKVVEGAIQKLDIKGKEITGELAKLYFLQKK
ncbi:copper resistance protein NlpE [Tenacibaculum sp. SDUM215027]|uniref:copper resistance protein NlpE n=1 Tax=Tenacibaculum sp. SDUM215027 TaxID=3422596 RepID=UPI003D320D2A